MQQPNGVYKKLVSLQFVEDWYCFNCSRYAGGVT
jgi:hypothetical protein